MVNGIKRQLLMRRLTPFWLTISGVSLIISDLRMPGFIDGLGQARPATSIIFDLGSPSEWRYFSALLARSNLKARLDVIDR